MHGSGLMDQLFRLSVRGGIWLRYKSRGVGFRLAIRHVDVLVVPWFLEAALLLAYLTARLASICIPLALGQLARKAAPHLVRLARAENQQLFRAAAARINLGYMMVCGAVALIVLSLTPVLAQVVGIADPAFDHILIWLVLGQSAPALFGATGLLMYAVERGTFDDLLLGITGAMFLAGIWTLNPQDGLLVAQTFAAAQLAHAAIGALLLTQCGVWPGLTALFHKEIKLF